VNDVIYNGTHEHRECHWVIVGKEGLFSIGIKISLLFYRHRNKLRGHIEK